jgi:hypothetical protein
LTHTIYFHCLKFFFSFDYNVTLCALCILIHYLNLKVSAHSIISEITIIVHTVLLNTSIKFSLPIMVIRTQCWCIWLFTYWSLARTRLFRIFLFVASYKDVDSSCVCVMQLLTIIMDASTKKNNLFYSQHADQQGNFKCFPSLNKIKHLAIFNFDQIPSQPSTDIH